MIKQGRLRFIVTALVVPITLYVVLLVSPYLQAIWMSFTDWTGFTAGSNFVGLDNYRRLLTDPVFWISLQHNLIAAVVIPLVVLTLALFFASMIHLGSRRGARGIRGGSIYRMLYFFPHVLSIAVVGVLWSFVYDPTQYGLLNTALGRLGIPPVNWLGSTDTAFGSILAVMVWGGVGFYVVLFSSAIANVPTEVYEAATIDGATRWQTFWQITLPLIWDTVQVAAIYLGMNALDMFVLVNTMSANDGSGGPDHSTQVLGNLLFISAFSDNDFGYATAVGVALLILTMALTLVTFRLSRREAVEF